MLKELNDQNRAERDQIVVDIRAAFVDVVRGDHGISWNECVAIDNYESPNVREAARRSDVDKRWSELVDDPRWEPFPGIGGFSFINVEGFRYYLPPTMVRFLHGDIAEWFPGHLLGVIERFTEPDLLSMWSEAQLRCIARFISFMARHDELWPGEPNPWEGALTRRWRAYLPA